MAKKRLKKFSILNFQLSINKFFPQISRKITAGFKIFVILLLISWLGFNLFSSFSPSDNLKTAVLKNLRKPSIHLELANQLLKNNQLKEAEREVLYSLQFSPNNQNLRQKLEEIRKIKNQPAELRKEIQKWEKIVQNKPDYRDGYFQLAVLHYQLYEDKKAKVYLEKVLSLDPNFEPGKRLKDLMGKN